MVGKSSKGRGGKAVAPRTNKSTVVSGKSAQISGKSPQISGHSASSRGGASSSKRPLTRGGGNVSGGGRSSSQSSTPSAFATPSGSPSPSSHPRRQTVFPPVNLQPSTSAPPPFPINLPYTLPPIQTQRHLTDTSPPQLLPRQRPAPRQDPQHEQPPLQPQFDEDEYVEEEEEQHESDEDSESDGEWECPPEAREPPVPLDYEALIDGLLQLPGRHHLPVLSKQRIIDGVETLWFTRDNGKLSREIGKIFRRKFDGPYYSWGVTPMHIQERYFRTFAKKYNWDGAITEDVKAGFLKIAQKRMKGIVSQAKTSGKKPTWIVKKLWRHMWKHWKTPDAIEKSDNASNSRNSDRGGLGVHKHLSGQKSYLQVQQELEEELGRPVSLGEVFLRTHTRADGTFVDQKAKQVAEAYEKNLEEIMSQMEGDGPDNSETSTETSTHRNLSVEQQNEIFLKCTQTDDKGNPFGLGRLAEIISKGKRKQSSEGSSSSSILEQQLEETRRKIVKQDEAHKDALSRLSSMETVLTFLKNKDPELAEFMDAHLPPANPATTPTTDPGNASATAHATAPATEEGITPATHDPVSENGSVLPSNSQN